MLCVLDGEGLMPTLGCGVGREAAASSTSILTERTLGDRCGSDARGVDVVGETELLCGVPW